MDTHAYLNKRFPSAIAHSCRRGNCTLRLDGAAFREITIVDADEYARLGRHRKRICDFFLFATARKLLVVVVEMKGGEVDASTAVQQLSSGARECETLVARGVACGFHAVLLHGGGIHASQIKILRGRGVRFRGKAYPITSRRCGSLLQEIVGEPRA